MVIAMQKNASSMATFLIPQLLYTFDSIKVHNIYVDAIAYPFHVLQLYIPYQKYHI
jgi:hypothetical protein